MAEIPQLLSGPWDTEPDAINEIGVKWWLDKSTTQYAARCVKLKNLKTDIKVFFVETPYGARSRLIIQDGQMVSDHQCIESVEDKIDQIILAWQPSMKPLKRMTPKASRMKKCLGNVNVTNEAAGVSK